MVRNVPPEVARHRARVAGLVSQGAAPEDVEAPRRQLEEHKRRAALDTHIDQVVAGAPEMTAEQRARLALVSARPPRASWRLVPEGEFPLDGVLTLLFEPAASRVEGEEGGGGRAPS